MISNLYSHESYIEGADESHNLLRNALFGSVYNGEVKNLGVADAEIWIDPKDNSSAGKGILVDWMGKSKITNCWTSGSIYSGTKIEKNIGGIVGVTVQGCTIPVAIQQQHLQVISQIPRDIIQNRTRLIGRSIPLAVLLAQDLTAI